MLKNFGLLFLSVFSLAAAMPFFLAAGCFLWKLYELEFTITGVILGFVPVTLGLSLLISAALLYTSYSFVYLNEAMPKRLKFLKTKFIFFEDTD